MSLNSWQHIRKLIQEEKPRFICLRDPEGKPVLPWNIPGKMQQRLKEIPEALQRKSLADGIYQVGIRNNLGKTYPERFFPIAKGKVNLEDPNPVITSSPKADPEQVWTASKAVEILNEKNRLELEKEQLEEKLKQLQADLQEQEEELEEEEEEETSMGSHIIDGLTILSEVFSPFLKKHQELSEQKIKLAERKIKLEEIKAQRSYASKLEAEGIRPAGRPDARDPLYNRYLAGLIQEGKEQELMQELEYLAEADPEKYNLVISNLNQDTNQPTNGQRNSG